jgi:hypothetical protein
MVHDDTMIGINMQGYSLAHGSAQEEIQTLLDRFIRVFQQSLIEWWTSNLVVGSWNSSE